MKTLTENLKQWRADRNINNSSYPEFVKYILEELLEPCFTKEEIEFRTKKIYDEHFYSLEWGLKTNELRVLDTIKDIKVFCTNETELMGYDDVKTDREVFKHINCRKQDPIQKEQWEKFGPYGKWQKDKNQDPSEIYEPDYASCKCSK